MYGNSGFIGNPVFDDVEGANKRGFCERFRRIGSKKGVLFGLSRAMKLRSGGS
jgi:hypothetical protein